MFKGFREKIEGGKGSKTVNTSISPFEEHIMEFATPMLELCLFALRAQHKKIFPCKDFLKKLNTEATSIEELVDSYGAQKNEKWFPFREAVAAEKLFTSVFYNLIHIREALSRYKLLDVKDNFVKDTDNVLGKMKKAIVSISETMLEQAERCQVCNPEIATDYKGCEEKLLPVSLPGDRKIRHVDKIGETVVYLSTQFLNLSEDRDVQEVLKNQKVKNYTELVPDIVNEEKLRLVESRFHNLQSLYDTYIFESDMESQNRNLPFLRGHISVIYHLLQMATELTHYYIRHMSTLSRTTFEELRFPLITNELLWIIFEYFLHYARLYMESAIHLCQNMIKSYSKQKEITVPIPNYRGFHVRPSTLIAKIVAHYGSSVTMVLNGKEYNAGITLELFRANEEINAMKRRQIAEIIRKRPELQEPVPSGFEAIQKKLQMLFLDLMNKNEIILYDSNLSFEDLTPVEGSTFADLASRYIKHYMSISKIDVKSDLHVTFKGDNRALNDIKILAENGYGEDKFGNNIVLPEELSYLRR